MEGQNACIQIAPPTVAVVMVPFPAQGHLNQLLQLSHLITSYGLPVHFAGSSSHNRQAKLRLHGWGSQSLSKIHFHDFQLPPYTNPLPNPDPSIPFPTHLQPLFNASLHLRQPVSQLLEQLSCKFRRVIMIHDALLASVVQDAKILSNTESYVFVPISAFTTFFNAWSRFPEKPFLIDSESPKCVPSMDECLPFEFLHFLANQKKCLGFESGWLYNTSRVIEGRYVELFEKLLICPEKKHFAIGPVNSVEMENKNGKHICLEWLNKQQKDSVIYISFGSTTSMTDDQITELALGLEKSQQKFIWVLRKADTGDVFTSAEVRKDQLPEGYDERVKNRGMVVRDWAPQLEILGHPATGGFMSHCGWNSCMESISLGVPIAAWPMHSDQPSNAVLVTEVLKVGVLVRDWTQHAELVSSKTIDSALRRLMASAEGKEMRKRATELGDAVRASVVEGGASRLEMDAFISHITRK
ncbi:hypothetical protein SOVF_104170 [Spinacia oleracea]|uniref:Glycosyltransferase n=1 Tax=Spinacia oleracea TaxID=3562 RepID=A0A9R0JCK1_SPIOL|nr:zeatin O-xylosyltransferase-like [Spinacia oleracea]KNA14805.1 hypothetical protein SOVF_104170 [Spinacia oleracea]